jgi:secreted protein
MSVQTTPAQATANSKKSGFKGWKLLAITLSLLLAGMVIYASMKEELTKEPYDIHSVSSDGVRALAQVLNDHYDVSVDQVPSAAKAILAAQQGKPVTIFNAGRLQNNDFETLLTTSNADITLVGFGYYLLESLAESGLELQGYNDKPASRGTCSISTKAQTISATGNAIIVRDPQALADSQYLGRGPAQLCFAYADGYGYLELPLKSGKTLRIITNPELVTNKYLDKDDNAALALYATGRGSEVAFYNAENADSFNSDQQLKPYPSWLVPLMWQFALLALVWAFIVGRRQGRIVNEPLPVVAQGTETTVGRAGLYQRARASEHSGRILRIATIIRLGRRLGISPNADATLVTQTVSMACNRTAKEIEYILYGPAPASAVELTQLSQALEQLEEEVKHYER